MTSTLSNLLAAVKVLAVFVYLSSFIGVGLIVGFCLRNSRRRRHVLARLVSIWAKVGLWLLRVIPHSELTCEPNALKENFLVVSNHLCYLDILVISSCFPSVYVTSREIQEHPFLGRVTDAAACAYVERRDRSKLAAEIAEVGKLIQNGLNVVIFPEATSTNGSAILKFR